jgi:DNA-binding XRE family transcriptional regulator
MSTKRAKKFLLENFGPFTFGTFLRGCRASQDKTQTEMAKFLGMSKSCLCDIEKGRQGVSPKLAAQIAEKCGLSRIVAVEAAIRDSLERAGLNLEVSVRKKAN